jgi:hypothetical protein
MKFLPVQLTRPLGGIAAFAILSACSSDLTGGNRHNVQLSFTTNATVTSAANRVAADLFVGANNELVLQKVQLVFGKLELDQRGAADCVGEVENQNDDHGDENGNNAGSAECEDVDLNPVLVEVPVDDALHPVINVPLPAGTFSQLEAKLEPARDRFTNFNTANPNLVGKSVRVEGTFNGTSFVFTSPVRAKVEMNFDPPLVIDETTRNATVAIDVRKWFLNPDGSVIDPATATPGSSTLLQIENNIRRSFHAFEDDDERGEDHHEGHNGNDDGEHH